MSLTFGRRRRFAALACASVTLGVLALAGSAVAKPAQPRESRTYIGTVSGTKAFAAIVVRRGVGIAYVCDAVRTRRLMRGPRTSVAHRPSPPRRGSFGPRRSALPC